MKNLLFTFILISVFYSSMFCQHPSVFLKDIYDVEWCQKSNIKTLESGGDDYYFLNGVSIYDNSKDVITEKKGTVIKLTIGHGKIHITTHLTSDLKRLKSTKIDNRKTYYYYDDENLLSYKVHHADVHRQYLQYMEAYRLEEMSRNSDGLLTSKVVYNYNKPIVKYKGDIKKMQSMDRDLNSLWNYKYNEKNELVEIIIKYYHKEDNSNTEQGINTIKVKHENSVPISLEIASSGKTPMLIRSKSRFSYTY